ncbi:MAG: SDR family oxidoreductase [Rhodospirillales bacterium]|nr:SDR family oxidoreductase [Rhodospirillales bacterium]
MGSRLFDLFGKIALVTGSARGIGLVMARGLAEAGATVVLNDIDADQLDASVGMLRGSEDLNAHGVPFDVTDSSAVDAGVAEIEERFGRIDILLNNAGIQRRFPLVEFPDKEWNDVLEVNLTAPFYVARSVVKGMIERKAGKIVNICSLQSAVTRPTIPAYTASKGGIAMLTKSMAVEWGPYNIQTNGIGPGYLKTEMTKRLWKDSEFDAWLCQRVPAGRWGAPEELVGAAVFLSSEASSYVNGQIVFVEGGLLSGM